MIKVIYQFFITVVIFLAMWLALSKLDLVGFFQVEEVTQYSEEKLKEIVWKTIEYNNSEITTNEVKEPIDSIFQLIINKNNIYSNIELKVVDNQMVNAYAIPGNMIIVNSGLIDYCDNIEELAGVISHEIAHIENNHLKKKLLKEYGLATLIAITTGNENSKLAKDLLNNLTSKAFDRKLETEADKTGVEYLKNAKISPQYFVAFFKKLLKKDNASKSILDFMNTHPHLKDRIIEIEKSYDKDLYYFDYKNTNLDSLKTYLN